MTIIDRLARNAEKQKRFRHIARFPNQTERERKIRKRIADIYFLRHYAGWTYSALARQFGVSAERARQIALKKTTLITFTVCHPKRSCML